MWQDLLTDEKFVRKDIITIQDPLKLEGKQLDVGGPHRPALASALSRDATEPVAACACTKVCCGVACFAVV